MPAPTNVSEFLELVQKSGVLDDKKLDAYLDRLRAAHTLPNRPNDLAGLLVRDGMLTHFQAEQILQGKWKRFTIGKYKVLEKLGSGGMGSVFLAEHKLMRRRVAVKVLPTAKAEDPSSLERFYREARAVAALDHPNIVRAYDIDQDEKLHFLVMEYVDGASLQEIVRRSGPLDPVRAAHYVRQAAQGLQHAHEAAGLVHRDIKPGNILVDRAGTVKVLDMGLARFFHDEEDILTKKYDENVLGTADYLAPEQALDSHAVDIRADIYSLGATFYFCLTGKTPFTEGTVAQKLIWHQTKHPRPIASFRADVPAGMVALVERMMAKEPGRRFQTPLEVVEALAPWTQAAIGPPSDGEIPRLCPALGEKTTADGPQSTPAPKELSTAPPTPAAAPRLPPHSATLSPGATLEAPPRRAAAPLPARNGQPQPLVPPAEEDDEPWERLAGETDGPAAGTEAAPGHGPGRGSSIHRTLPPVRIRPWWETVLVGVLVVGAVLAAVTALVVWLVFRQPAGGGTVAPENPPLLVSRAGGPGTFPTLALALGRVKAGGRIVVQDDKIEEDLALTAQKCPRGVTVEGEPGKTVTWVGPMNADDAYALLGVDGVEDLHLRHLTFDGGGRRQKLILLQGECAGTTLEGLELRGFQRCAVLVMNCKGTADRPVTFRDLQISNAREAEAGLLFDTNPSMRTVKVNEYFHVQDCRFEGPLTKPIRKKSPVQHLDTSGRNVQVVGGKEIPF